MPRPRWAPTQEQLRQIETLAGYGLTQVQIAQAMGMAPDTFKHRKAYLPAVQAAVDAGMAKAAGRVGQALFRRAADGDIQAIRWWEMTRLKRRPMQAENDQGGTEHLIRVVGFEVEEYED